VAEEFARRCSMVYTRCGALERERTGSSTSSRPTTCIAGSASGWLMESRQSTCHMSFLPDLKDLHFLLLPDCQRCLWSGITAPLFGVPCTGSSAARPLCSSLHSHPRNKRNGMLSTECLAASLRKTPLAGMVLHSRSQGPAVLRWGAVKWRLLR
jgi:hypothetical protein